VDTPRKEVNLQVLDQNIDTIDATGRLLFNMLGAIAQFETELRAERQMDGIQKAKKRGVRFGPKKRLTEEQTAELRRQREQGALIKTLMQDYGLSKVSVYRYLGQTDRAFSDQNTSSLREHDEATNAKNSPTT
jgi:DNA invertase Pin-like site-specific DNA recombinase